MSYGFYVKGSAGHFIIDDRNPVLAQRFRGDLRVNMPYYVNTPWFRGNFHGACDVTYPEPVSTYDPPWVFGVPTSAGPSGGGVGYFAHKGGRGNWTGFRVYYTRSLDYDARLTFQKDHHTGWEYRVCSFHLPPSNARYGMRVWSADRRLLFDSGWPVTPLRGLLRNWRFAYARKTGRLIYNAYWGNLDYNPNKDCDGTYQVYTHPWGAADGTMGVLISQLGAMTFYGDDGYKDRSEKVSAPMVGFLGGDRTNIACGLHLGILQHAGASVEPFNNFAMLTADFSKT